MFYATGGLFLITGLQLFVPSGETATYFAWTLTPPVAAAALGSAYLAAGVAQLLAARHNPWVRARVAVPWIGVFAVFTQLFWKVVGLLATEA